MKLTISGMKKIIASIVTLFTFVLPTSAQIFWGIKAGMNVTSVSLSTSTFDSENRFGYFFGPHMDIAIPGSHIGFDIAALYDSKTIGSKKKTETLSYVDIPVNITYTSWLGRNATLYFATGPQFAWNVGESGIFNNSYTLRSSLFSWNVGGGFTLLRTVRIGYTYNIPCGYTAELNSVGNTLNKANFKSHNHQIHLTYLF